MAAYVPGRTERNRIRAELAALAARQGTGEGRPTYIPPRTFDTAPTGYVIQNYDTPADEVATPVATPLQTALPTGNFHSVGCGCATCGRGKGG